MGKYVIRLENTNRIIAAGLTYQLADGHYIKVQAILSVEVMYGVTIVTVMAT